MEKYLKSLLSAYKEAANELDTKKQLIEAQAEYLKEILEREGEPEAEIMLSEEAKDFFSSSRDVFEDEDMNYVVLKAAGKNNGYLYLVEIFGNEDEEAYQGYSFEPFLLRNKGDIWEYLVEDNWMDCQFDEDEEDEEYFDEDPNFDEEEMDASDIEYSDIDEMELKDE